MARLYGIRMVLTCSVELVVNWMRSIENQMIAAAGYADHDGRAGGLGLVRRRAAESAVHGYFLGSDPTDSLAPYVEAESPPRWGQV